MPYAILRTAKLKSAGEIGGSLAHTFRTRDTPNADPARHARNEHMGPSSPEGVKAGIEARLPEKRRKDAVLCIEYFIGASPEVFGKNQTGGEQYFRAAMDWLRERHGAENVISGHVHRDETTPHLVAYVVPRDGEKLNAKKWLGGKAALSAMQTDFAEKVGKPFGLERGLEGSKAVHQTIRQFYAEANAIARAEPDAAAKIEADLKPERQMVSKSFWTTTYETPEQAMKRVVTTAKQQISEVQKRADKLESENQALKRERKVLIGEAKKVREQFGELLDVARKLPRDQLAKVVAGIRSTIEATAKARQLLKKGLSKGQDSGAEL